ncbi:MAG: ion channel [Candidatus Pacearchaeota archaeon]
MVFFKSKSKFLFLFISLILLLILNPLLEGNLFFRVIFFLAVSFVPLSVIYSASFNKKQFFWAVIFSIIFATTHLVMLFKPSSSMAIFDLLATVLFFGYTIFIIFSYIFKTKEINADAIYGAVSVYLLIGAIWASIFFTIESVSPGSFSGVQNPAVLSDFIYFSYSTLITLVYGDITPVGSLVRSLASLEAITGAMYLAITIARLVGLYGNKSK